MVDYPAEFRIPEFENFVTVHHIGAARTAMDSGRARQRRRYKNVPLRFAMSVRVSTTDFATWLAWWNANAYAWFNMPVQSVYAFEAGSNCAPMAVRCISPLQVAQMSSFGWVQVDFEVESHPETLDNNPEPVAVQTTARGRRTERKRKPRSQSPAKQRKRASGAARRVSKGKAKKTAKK